MEDREGEDKSSRNFNTPKLLKVLIRYIHVTKPYDEVV